MTSKDSKVDKCNMGTHTHPPDTEAGYSRRPRKDGHGGRASVVVRARESRVHGKGRQKTDTLAKPEQRPVDSGHQFDKAWLLSVQSKLYQWSQQNPKDRYRELFNWVTDLRNLRCAWHKVAANKGKRTPGIDGKTEGSIRRDEGEEAFVERLRVELRSGNYRPSPCRRKLIPKRGKPVKFRPLGIPTITT